MELVEWSSTGEFQYGYMPLVSESRADIIRRQYPSTDDQKKEVAIYYVTCDPWASWGDLAKHLYLAGEERAMQVFKALLPKPKGNRVTVLSE